MDRHSAPVVLKLGGSLLDLPDLRRRIDDVLLHYRRFPLLLVVGGGAAADLVRDWDRRHELGDEIAHRLALETMTLNARCVAAVINDAELVESPQQWAACRERGRVGIVNAAEFVPTLERTTGQTLPQNWDVTSDSISAWIAGWMQADRLVLLKSVDLPEDDRLSPGCSLVDAAFSTMCRGVQCVEWINLRAEAPVPRNVRLS